MDLFSKEEIQALLKEHRVVPSKKFGQNFLIDREFVSKITTAASLRKEDTVLEIGPGIGNLTQELAKNAKHVFAIEKDQAMITVLKETTKNYNNITIIHGDALEEKIPFAGPYKIIANLPYYITSPLIRKFLETTNQPTGIIVMVQKEVADRICAKTPKMNLLAVSVQFYATVTLEALVPKEVFWPMPSVNSAIIKITPKNETLPCEPALFFRIVKAGFSQPRKQLINNFSAHLQISRDATTTWLLNNKIAPEQRAQTLTMDNWISLTQTFGIINK